MQTGPSKLVLFDLDGTLLLTGGAGLRAMARAAFDLFGDGFSWDGVNPSGGLDPALFEEAARRSGLAVGLEEHAGFRRRYIAHLREELARSPDVRVMPGIRQVLEALRAREDVLPGILTGNYEPTADLKLEAAGIPPEWFRVRVFGDEAKTRPELVLLALARAEEMAGRPVSPASVVVVGDTPRDIHCALANGCRAFAVATGRYSVRELLEAGAQAAVEDLADPLPFFEFLEDRGRTGATPARS